MIFLEGELCRHHFGTIAGCLVQSDIAEAVLAAVVVDVIAVFVCKIIDAIRVRFSVLLEQMECPLVGFRNFKHDFSPVPIGSRMLCRRRSSCTVVPLPKTLVFFDNGNRYKAPVKAMRRAVPQRPTRDCISGPRLHMNKWGVRFQPPPVSSRFPAGCLSAEVSSFNPPCSPPRSAVVSGGRYKIDRSSAESGVMALLPWTALTVSKGS